MNSQLFEIWQYYKADILLEVKQQRKFKPEKEKIIDSMGLCMNNVILADKGKKTTTVNRELFQNIIDINNEEIEIYKELLK
jgi:hypothetical protein